MTLALEQALNGVQFGVMLFLMAAGLTLVFGIMNLVNLAHGSLYMVGAYLATTFSQWTGSFLLRPRSSRWPATLVVGSPVEAVALRTLYERDHLDQVLATFGLILFFNELVAIVWGRAALYTSRAAVRCPATSGPPRGALSRLPGSSIILVGLAVAALLYVRGRRGRGSGC